MSSQKPRYPKFLNVKYLWDDNDDAKVPEEPRAPDDPKTWPPFPIGSKAPVAPRTRNSVELAEREPLHADVCLQTTTNLDIHWHTAEPCSYLPPRRWLGMTGEEAAQIPIMTRAERLGISHGNSRRDAVHPAPGASASKVEQEPKRGEHAMNRTLQWLDGLDKPAYDSQRTALAIPPKHTRSRKLKLRQGTWQSETSSTAATLVNADEEPHAGPEDSRHMNPWPTPPPKYGRHATIPISRPPIPGLCPVEVKQDGRVPGSDRYRANGGALDTLEKIVEDI